MKITIFIGGLSGGGAERVCTNMANDFIGKGHQVEFLTMTDEPSTYHIKSGISRYSLLKVCERKNFIFNSVLRIVRLVRYLIFHKCDVYVVMLPVTTILLLTLKRLTSAKIIASERVDPSSYTVDKQKRLKKLAKKADGWVFQTVEEYEWYKDYLNSCKHTIIPNAINPVFLDVSIPLHREKIIVTAGRLKESKNQQLLINAFSKIIKVHPDYRLIIYGEGPIRDKLMQLVVKHGLSDKVEIPGFSMNMVEDLNKASVFVLPSDHEGMPNVLIEAMALGLPCISTDCDGGGARFLLKDSENGILIPKNDELSLIDAINKVIEDDLYAKKIADKARDFTKELAPTLIYNKWESFIMEVVKQ